MFCQTIPGTAMPYTNLNASAFSMIEPLLTAAGGLSLSQVCAITGLEGSTIQNWVKRGWVENPKAKKYGEAQLSRVLIISALRDSLQLEQIVQLLRFVNGSVSDRKDDIIKESRLYDYLCAAVKLLRPEEGVSEQKVKALVDSLISDYRGPALDSKQRLSRALTVMVLAYLSGSFKRQADRSLREIL